MHHLAFAIAVIAIGLYVLGCIVFYTNLFAHFALQGFCDALAIADMSAHGGVPIPRQQVFVHSPTLQIQRALGREYMQMHHRMQHMTTIMTGLPCGFPQHLTCLIDYRKILLHIWCD